MPEAQLELSNTLTVALEEDVSRIDAANLPPEKITMLVFMKLRKDRPNAFNPMVQGNQAVWMLS